MKDTLEAPLASLAATALPQPAALAQRQRLYEAFMAFVGETEHGALLEVSAAGGGPDSLAAWCQPRHRSRIVSCAVDAGGAAGRQRFLREDGRHLPFSDGEFDWVFCQAAIERAGGFEHQCELLRELDRVARKGIFVATPNRRHPLEFHTGLPFLHWLPAPWWRRALLLAGKRARASANGLDLLDAPALRRLASGLPGQPEVDVGHIRLGGIKAQLFLLVRKGG